MDIAYQEVRAQFTRKQSARKLVDDHLDPILKAADELVGKLRFLADEDFARRFRWVDIEFERQHIRILLTKNHESRGGFVKFSGSGSLNTTLMVAVSPRLKLRATGSGLG